MEATVRVGKGLESKLERLPPGTRVPRIELINGLARFVVSVDSSEKLAKLGEVLESLPKVGDEGRPKRQRSRPRGCATWSGCFGTGRG